MAKYQNLSLGVNHQVNMAIAEATKISAHIDIFIDMSKIGGRLQEIRKKSQNILIDRGTFAIRKGGVFSAYGQTTRKLWAVARNFGDMITEIQLKTDKTVLTGRKIYNNDLECYVEEELPVWKIIYKK